jgi:hypothetical protein
MILTGKTQAGQIIEPVKENPDETTDYANKSHNELQNQFGVLALYMTYEFNGRQNSYPVYVSDISTSLYVDKDDFEQETFDSTICEIPWVTARRINTDLKLKKTYS